MLTHLMSWLESDNRGRQRLALAESLMRVPIGRASELLIAANASAAGVTPT